MKNETQMIEIDLGLNINPSPLYYKLIEDVMVAIRTIFKDATFDYNYSTYNSYSENQVEYIECTDFSIEFNDTNNTLLLLQENNKNCCICFNFDEENENEFKIQKKDFNFDCILIHIENELNVKFNQNEINSAITYFSDLWD